MYILDMHLLLKLSSGNHIYVSEYGKVTYCFYLVDNTETAFFCLLYVLLGQFTTQVAVRPRRIGVFKTQAWPRSTTNCIFYMSSGFFLVLLYPQDSGPEPEQSSD